MASTEFHPLHYEHGLRSLVAKTSDNEQVMGLTWGDNYQWFSWLTLSSQAGFRKFILDTPALGDSETKQPKKKERPDKDYLEMKFGSLAVIWSTKESAPPAHNEISLLFEGRLGLESIFLAREILMRTASNMIRLNEIHRFMTEGVYPIFIGDNPDFIPEVPDLS